MPEIHLYNPRSVNARREIITVDNVLFLQQHIINLEVEKRNLLNILETERKERERIENTPRQCSKCEEIAACRRWTNKKMVPPQHRNVARGNYVNYYGRK